MPSSRQSRRRFLQLATAAPAALALRSLAGGSTLRAADAPAVKKVPIGIELYGVRGELAKDLPNTLRTVAKIGYEVVEFYAPYYGWTLDFAKGVRAQLDDLGLRCLSTHNGFESLTPGATMVHAVELNHILGTRQVILSSAPRGTKTAEDWKRLCGQLTTAVQELKPHGLAAGFHNHHSEWLPLEGGPRVMDILAGNTPPEFILQLDVGTAVEAGVDTVAWIKANPGRIKSIHLKDWAPGDKAEEKGYRVLFGEGVTPWKELVAAAESVGGVEHYLMEQEGSRFSEFETAEKCLASWKKLRAGG
ncbi:MAG TPA: sugar phosphate isomerase/epimerase [Chthoniobacteraceae bacterium]|nr:sugar phosphate isomerase/epimerase [Chthoniobacteraceae bacterium]